MATNIFTENLRKAFIKKHYNVADPLSDASKDGLLALDVFAAVVNLPMFKFSKEAKASILDIKNTSKQ